MTATLTKNTEVATGTSVVSKHEPDQSDSSMMFRLPEATYREFRPTATLDSPLPLDWFQYGPRHVPSSGTERDTLMVWPEVRPHNSSQMILDELQDRLLVDSETEQPVDWNEVTAVTRLLRLFRPPALAQVAALTIQDAPAMHALTFSSLGEWRAVTTTASEPPNARRDVEDALWSLILSAETNQTLSESDLASLNVDAAIAPLEVSSSTELQSEPEAIEDLVAFGPLQNARVVQAKVVSRGPLKPLVVPDDFVDS